MRAILPRQRSCVLCSDPIEGKGRIDRLYCSASCRNLAWRFRAGKRAGKAHAAAPVEAARRRGGLLRQAWGLQGEVAATRRRIGDLQAQRAHAEAQVTAERQRLAEARAAWTQERAAWNAERASLRAELAAAQEQAAHDQAALQAVNRAYSTLIQDQTTRAVERIPAAPADPLTEQQRPLSHSKPQDQPCENVATPTKDATRPTCPPSAQTSPPAVTAAQPPSDHPPPTADSDTPPPKQEPPRAESWWQRVRKKLAEPDSRRGRHLLD